MASQLRRAPAKEKTISEIDPENDIRVRIIGTIVSKDENNIVLDDGDTRAEIFFDDRNILDRFEVGDIVRVISRVLPSIDGFELKGECIQDLKGLDINTYKNIRKVYESILG